MSELGPDAVDAGLLLLRVLVGGTFSLHGFQKLFGWFGGGGLEATAGWFRSLGCRSVDEGSELNGSLGCWR